MFKTGHFHLAKNRTFSLCLDMGLIEKSKALGSSDDLAATFNFPCLLDNHQ